MTDPACHNVRPALLILKDPALCWVRMGSAWNLLCWPTGDKMISVSVRTAERARGIAEDLIHDSAIRPSVCEVGQYGNYRRFRNAHRARWEQSRSFETYLERIVKLAQSDRSLRSKQCPSGAQWDTWYEQLVEPIKSLVWEAWERHHRLERRYYEELVRAGHLSPQHIADMAMAPAETERPSSPPERRGVIGRMIEMIAGPMGARA